MEETGPEKILLTGGSGFIATNFLQHVERERLAKVVLFDRKYGQDLCDATTVRKAILGKGYETIFHLGALTHIDSSIEDPRPFYETNVNGTFNILEAIREENTSRDADNQLRMVYISSSEVYGTSQTEPLPMNESHLIAPHSPYASSKAAADRLCYSYWQTYELPVKIVRPFNQYGPYQTEEKLIPKMIQRSLDGKPMPVYADGLAKRDWVFVRDTVEGIWMARDLPDGQAVNLATGKNYTVLEVCQLIKNLLKNKTSKIVHVDHVDDRWGHVKCLCGDATLAKQLIGWEARTSLAEGLRLTLNWYLAQWEIDNREVLAEPTFPEAEAAEVVLEARNR